MIIVKADMNAMVRGDNLENPVVEDDNNIMGYVADAILSACNAVIYAEATYGPIAADMIIEGLKGDIVKKSLEQVRMGAQECESEE